MKKSLIALALVFALGLGSVKPAQAVGLDFFYVGLPLMMGTLYTIKTVVEGIPVVVSKVKNYFHAQPESKGGIAFHLTGLAMTCVLAPYYALHGFGTGD
ncbi:MAG: hypothetical protein Nk1A_7330 [Endomicrobiia bacterium]|nr:MAG: hypothetical protein Nk1A_7330 [Endomicrobiia bacterium]